MKSVRKATTADAWGILACLSAAFEVYGDSYTPLAFADTILTPETMQRRFQEMTAFVATAKSGEIVGTIACSVVHPEEGHSRNGNTSHCARQQYCRAIVDTCGGTFPAKRLQADQPRYGWAQSAFAANSQQRQG